MLPHIFTFLSLAILFLTTPINALSLDSHHPRHQLIARNIRQSPAKRSSTGRCKPRPTTTIVHTSSIHIPTPTPSPTHSPTPTPSPSASPIQAKAGIAWPLGDDIALSYFKTNKVSLVYTWSPFKPKDTFGMEFCPMLWGRSQIEDFQRLVKPGYANCALGPNEPNLGDQSGLSPADAAGLWRQYMEPLKAHGYTLGSPAVTSAPSGKTWLQDFIKICPDCTIDFATVHWYGRKAEDFISYVTDFYHTFNKPIWVTEFACWDFTGGPQASLDEVFAFMDQVTNWMDNTPWVQRYMAFGVMRDMGNVGTTNQLMQPNGHPNDLGWDYIT